MNIFEGSRRIIKLISVAIVVGFGIAAFSTSYRPDIYYLVTSPTSTPQIIKDDDCPEESRTYYSRTQYSKADVRFCFTTETFKSSKTGNDVELYPYRYDKKTNTTFGSDFYSTEFEAYKSEVAKSFVIPTSDKSWVESKFWSKVIKTLKDGFFYMIITLAVFWALTFSIGWIVRGFMGIPRGQDAKIKETK